MTSIVGAILTTMENGGRNGIMRWWYPLLTSAPGSVWGWM